MNLDRTDFLPILFVLAVVFLAVGAYRTLQWLLYRKHESSPEISLDTAQLARYEQYQHATALQLKQNRLHNRAIAGKNRYEYVGVAACAVAPALIVLTAFGPVMKAQGFASDGGIRLAQVAGILAVLVFIIVFRKPTKVFLELRLRAEFLRVHLHCLLAGVGHYENDESEATVALQKSDVLTQTQLLKELRTLERLCSEQAARGSFPPINRPKAEAYFVERIHEQVGDADKPTGGYFHQAARYKQAQYRWSGFAVAASVVLAFVAASLSALGVAPSWMNPTVAVCGAVAIFFVAARSVLGWDSKAALYYRQLDALNDLAAAMHHEFHLGQGIGLTDLPGSFRKNAALFEALMAREVCDFVLIADRETFDITF